MHQVTLTPDTVSPQLCLFIPHQKNLPLQAFAGPWIFSSPENLCSEE